MISIITYKTCKENGTTFSNICFQGKTDLCVYLASQILSNQIGLMGSPGFTHNPTRQQVQAAMRSFIHSCSLRPLPLSFLSPLQDALLCPSLTESQLYGVGDVTCTGTHTDLRLAFITLPPRLLEEMSDDKAQQTSALFG